MLIECHGSYSYTVSTVLTRRLVFELFRTEYAGCNTDTRHVCYYWYDFDVETHLILSDEIYNYFSILSIFLHYGVLIAEIVHIGKH